MEWRSRVESRFRVVEGGMGRETGWGEGEIWKGPSGGRRPPNMAAIAATSAPAEVLVRRPGGGIEKGGWAREDGGAVWMTSGG